jgi:hypothetical protein
MKQSPHATSVGEDCGFVSFKQMHHRNVPRMDASIAGSANGNVPKSAHLALTV